MIRPYSPNIPKTPDSIDTDTQLHTQSAKTNQTITSINFNNTLWHPTVMKVLRTSVSGSSLLWWRSYGSLSVDLLFCDEGLIAPTDVFNGWINWYTKESREKYSSTNQFDPTILSLCRIFKRKKIFGSADIIKIPELVPQGNSSISLRTPTHPGVLCWDMVHGFSTLPPPVCRSAVS